MRSVSKKHRVIIISIAVLAVVGIAGILGYMYWSGTQKQKVPSLQQMAIEREEDRKKESEASQSASRDSNDGYLVLKDWGVKFKIPDNIGEVVYYKKSFRNTLQPNMGETVEGYELTTKRLEALGGRCVDSPDGTEAVRLGAISRTKTKQEKTIIGPTYLNDGQPIDGYYYIVAYAQTACTMKDIDIQNQDRRLIGDLLQSITVI